VNGHQAEAALTDRVAALTPAQRAAAPLFLPYLSGERTPHNDPHAQGVLFGLRAEHDAASLGYAVLEGVAFGLRDGWTCMNRGARRGVATLAGRWRCTQRALGEADRFGNWRAFGHA